MTFQFRSLLPVMKRLVERNECVSVLSRGAFTKESIRRRPRHFNCVTKGSLRFVGEQIGLDTDFLGKVKYVPLIRRLHIPTASFYAKQDMFISTTKGFPWLNNMAKYGKPRIAIGYQNFLGTYYTENYELFPENCLPHLSFEKEIRRGIKIAFQETGLTFLDSYVERHRKSKIQRTDKVLLLHPGGFRDVITRTGESKHESFRKQTIFYKRILACIPPDMKLYVKIHPLAARHHDRKAHRHFAKNLDLSVIDGFLGDILSDYDVVLSMGSSALFEILPFRLSFWVLGFLSTKRTDLYKDIPSLFVKSEDELSHKIKKKIKPVLKKEFERDYYERLVKTTDGFSTDRVIKIIDNCS